MAPQVDSKLTWYKQRELKAKQEHQRILQDSKRVYESVLSKTKSEYEKKVVQMVLDRRQIIQSLKYLARDWDDSSWKNWSIKNAYTNPEAVRFGQLTVTGHIETQTFPALLPLLVNGCSVLFKANGAEKQKVAQAFQSVLLRLLAVVPPGKLRFTFIDPVALGDNVAPFMHLCDYDEKLVTSRAWSK